MGVAAFVAFAALPGKTTEAAVTTLELHLSGANEVPPVDGAGSAIARLTFDDTTNELTYVVTLNGIPAEEVIAAHIHRAEVGVNGPVVYTLADGPFSQIEGSITLTDQDVAELEAGLLYLNVHSQTHPNGFARAQIYLDQSTPIRAVYDEAAAAWNAGDVDGFVAHFTDRWLVENFGAGSVEEVLSFLPEILGDPPLEVINVTDIQVSGSTATAVADLAFGLQLERTLDRLVNEGGVWKIDSSEELPPPTAPGAVTVDMDLDEYSFIYDKSAVASGNFVFDVENVGEEFHEIILVSIAEGIDFQEALQSAEEGPPPGIEPVAQSFFEPGQSGTVAFTEPLDPGSYGLVCFVTAEDGTPHAFLGMVSEFTVGGGTISPPSTGDAGLADSGAPLREALLGVALLSLIAGGTLAATARFARNDA